MAIVKVRLKKGDNVRVISGKHKGSEGEIIHVYRNDGRVVVKGVNMVKKTLRPTQENPTGGFTEQEAAIHISNVQLIDPKNGQLTRIGYSFRDDGRKVRIAKASGTELDE